MDRPWTLDPTLSDSLTAGWALPATWYTDDDIARLERDRIFTRTWQLFGTGDALVEPGSFHAERIGHVPVVVTRDREGELRGFVNVCRHRGHLVAEGSGCRATLQCPYHAWTYGLDGSLVKAPRAENEPGFDPSVLSLRPVAVDTWGPFVFVNPDVDAAPLADTLAGIPELIATSGLDLSILRPHARFEWEAAINWKNALENYLECYHCAVAHPGFSRLLDVDADAYELIQRPLSSSQVGKVRPGVREGTAPAPYVPSGDVVDAQYHLIWPNTTINIDPGAPNLSIDTWVPDGPGRTRGVTQYFYGPDVPDDVIAEMTAFSQQVGAEDASLVENVQIGLESGLVPQGRLMPRSEVLIGHFQRLVFDHVAGDVSA